MNHSGLRRRALVIGILMTGLVFWLSPSAASAHSLDSSSISVHVSEEIVDARLSVALETVDLALGTTYADSADVASFSDDLNAYLADHLTVTGADGSVWGETFSNPERESVEGIESYSVDVLFDTGDSGTTGFTVAFDAIIEAIPGHEAVVVLTDADGDVSTAGVITSGAPTLQIGEASVETGALDMIGYGFDHVLDGADHLLFLTTLLLPAPLLVVGRRWRPGEGVGPTLRKVVHVITAFTLGHSLTLIASALGWVSIPNRPVEILIAVSVAVSAVHAIHPLTEHGEEIIAAGFGLIHGLAFAGILADLGVDGASSLLSLLAFNVGIEVSQLVVAGLIFPSLYVMSLTRFYPTVRIALATGALTLAIGWGFDRAGLIANPLSGVEAAAISHPWSVVIAVATLSAGLYLVHSRRAPVTSSPPIG